MKSFLDMLHERVVLRARKDMPQIDDMDAFLKDIKKNDISVKNMKVNPKTLKPTQNEFNQEKIDYLVSSGKYKTKNIVVTNDNYILDGHHRWKAYIKAKEDQPIVKIDMPFEELFNFVDGKPYIKYRKITESKLLEWFNSNMSMSDYMTDKKEITEDGEGGAVATGGEASSSTGDSTATDTSVNSVTGVAMPATAMGKVNRRKTNDHEYRD